MNNCWKFTKFGLVLLALPLVATAAASAHLQLSQSSAITVDAKVVSAETTTVGLDRVHTVALNRNGGVDGRIVMFDADSSVRGLSKLNVRFVKDGQTVSQGMTDTDGVFSAQNIPEGIYSFIASGENGFAAYSVRVLSDNSGAYDDVMEAVAVSQVDSVQKILADRPATFVRPVADKEAMDEKGANRVVLKNGVLTGRVLSIKPGKIENTQVHILKDGIPVAEVVANEDGGYQVADMKPGVYAMVAVGPQGIAAVSFEAVDSDSQTNNGEFKTVFVSTAAQDGQPIYTDVLNVYLINPQDNVQEQPIVQDPIYDDGGLLPIEYAGQDVAFGGAGGSFGPTTQTFAAPLRGGPGLGGRGRLLLIGGLTAGIIALANDGNPSMATPVTP